MQLIIPSVAEFASAEKDNLSPADLPCVGEPFRPALLKEHTCGRVYPPAIVGRQRGLTDGQKRLYALLYSRAGDNDTCWPSFDSLAYDLGKSERQVRSDVARLEGLRLIRHEWRNGRRSNTYVYLWHEWFERQSTAGQKEGRNRSERQSTAGQSSGNVPDAAGRKRQSTADLNGSPLPANSPKEPSQGTFSSSSTEPTVTVSSTEPQPPTLPEMMTENSAENVRTDFLIPLHSENPNGRASSSSDTGDSNANSPPTENETGPTTTDAPTIAPTLPVNESKDFQEELTGIFVRAGKPAPTQKQLVATAAALPSEAHVPYLDRLQERIDKVRHPGFLKPDVEAYATGWHVERERLRRLQAEAEAERLLQQKRDEDEAAERERLVREELLPDRYADPEEVNRVLEQYPKLRGYTPPPEHFRAVDFLHVRRALYDIQREGCPPTTKQAQRRRLEELEQSWPGIVEEVKHSSAMANDAFRYDAQHRLPQGEPLACSAKVGDG